MTPPLLLLLLPTAGCRGRSSCWFLRVVLCARTCCQIIAIALALGMMRLLACDDHMEREADERATANRQARRTAAQSKRPDRFSRSIRPLSVRSSGGHTGRWRWVLGGCVGCLGRVEDARRSQAARIFFVPIRPKERRSIHRGPLRVEIGSTRAPAKPGFSPTRSNSA